MYDIIPTKIWFGIFCSVSLSDLEWGLMGVVHAQQGTTFKVLLLTLLLQMTLFTMSYHLEGYLAHIHLLCVLMCIITDLGSSPKLSAR